MTQYLLVFLPALKFCAMKKERKKIKEEKEMSFVVGVVVLNRTFG